MATLAAVILAGGAGRRLSNMDKPALVVGGRTLLDRALDAVAAADPVVVVGPRRPTTYPVSWARERPPGGGPLAALAAGIDALPTDPTNSALVAVLAADLVGVTPSTIDRLVEAITTDDVAGAVLVDADGREQWLTGVWRTSTLRQAMPADVAGRSLRALFDTLPVRRLPALPGEADDVDTPADLRRLRG